MDPAFLESLAEHWHAGGPLMGFMAAVSVLVVAIALQRLIVVLAFRSALRRLDDGALEAIRRGDLEEGRRLCGRLPVAVREVVAAGLDRATGLVRGDVAQAMKREEKRALGRLRAWIWILGTAGALMPFVGLLGTVLGVMQAFQAIGASSTAGFSVVASGISEALIATAAGLFVALESVVLFNFLQNAINAQGRDLSLLVDEAVEVLRLPRTDHAVPPAAG